MWAQSKTENLVTIRHVPKIDRDEPILALLLKDMEEPRCRKSNTDNDEPKRPMPKRDRADPTYAMLWTDSDEPRWL